MVKSKNKTTKSKQVKSRQLNYNKSKQLKSNKTNKSNKSSKVKKTRINKTRKYKNKKKGGGKIRLCPIPDNFTQIHNQLKNQGHVDPEYLEPYSTGFTLRLEFENGEKLTPHSLNCLKKYMILISKSIGNNDDTEILDNTCNWNIMSPYPNDTPQLIREDCELTYLFARNTGINPLMDIESIIKLKATYKSKLFQSLSPFHGSELLKQNRIYDFNYNNNQSGGASGGELMMNIIVFGLGIIYVGITLGIGPFIGQAILRGIQLLYFLFVESLAYLSGRSCRAKKDEDTCNETSNCMWGSYEIDYVVGNKLRYLRHRTLDLCVSPIKHVILYLVYKNSNLLTSYEKVQGGGSLPELILFGNKQTLETFKKSNKNISGLFTLIHINNLLRDIVKFEDHDYSFEHYIAYAKKSNIPIQSAYSSKRLLIYDRVLSLGIDKQIIQFLKSDTDSFELSMKVPEQYNKHLKKDEDEAVIKILNDFNLDSGLIATIQNYITTIKKLGKGQLSEEDTKKWDNIKGFAIDPKILEVNTLDNLQNNLPEAMSPDNITSGKAYELIDNMSEIEKENLKAILAHKIFYDGECFGFGCEESDNEETFEGFGPEFNQEEQFNNAVKKNFN